MFGEGQFSESLFVQSTKGKQSDCDFFRYCAPDRLVANRQAPELGGIARFSEKS